MGRKRSSTIEKILHRVEDRVEEWRRQDQARKDEPRRRQGHQGLVARLRGVRVKVAAAGSRFRAVAPGRARAGGDALAS